MESHHLLEKNRSYIDYINGPISSNFNSSVKVPRKQKVPRTNVCLVKSIICFLGVQYGSVSENGKTSDIPVQMVMKIMGK